MKPGRSIISQAARSRRPGRCRLESVRRFAMAAPIGSLGAIGRTERHLDERSRAPPARAALGAPFQPGASVAVRADLVQEAARTVISVISAGANRRSGGPQKPVPRET